MKKILFLGLTVMLVLAFTGISYASVDTIYEAAVISYSGQVKVDTKGDGTWITPWVGMKLMQGALLKTGPDSKAEIVFDAEGLNLLQIDENAMITIDKSLVHLKEGSVLANFGNLTGGSTFAVQTPTAVCGIRGSGMGVDYINNMTVVAAYEDKVYVQGLDANGNPVDEEVAIPEGWKTSIGPDGKYKPPVELTENERLIFDAWVGAMEAGAGPEYKAEAQMDKFDDDMDGEENIDGKDLEEIKDEEKKEDISPSY
jgi:hypothetical protein